MKNSQPFLIAILVFLTILILCCCLALGVAGLSFITASQRTVIQPAYSEPTRAAQQPTTASPSTAPPTRESSLPTQSAASAPEEPAPAEPGPVLPAPAPLPGNLAETLDTLETTIVPVNDPIELAERLEGKQNLPTQLEFPVKLYRVGDRETFWVTDSDTNQNTEVAATLQYVTDHVYFWIQDGVQYNKNHLKALAETFETKIFPTNREFFGSEWTPGVDADPHLFILYARGLGGSVAGYFSSADEYLPGVREYTNGHEMFLLSADHVRFDEQFAYSVLAHEFQHMIHWYRDRNEETWLNEGAADLAAFLNGYSIGGHDWLYAANPSLQLNDWPSNAASSASHYGAAFLYMAYFLDRFGEEATKALVADPANGLVSIDNVLEDLGIRDPLTGNLIGADDLFVDWTIANFIQDKRVGDGRYIYKNYPSAPRIEQPSYTISRCPTELDAPIVHQYGVNYIQITCKGANLIQFEGASEVNVLPADPYSGNYAYYSNRGDESHMTLSRTFDFSDYSGALTLSYWTWYDIEQDYDYLYLTASTDGKTWQILTTPSGTVEDPSGNSYGWAYNGESGGGPRWIQEEVDLSQFAGKQVQLRFEYVTDAAVNGEGFLLDDLSIPQIGFFDDFEASDPAWEAEGFVRIQNQLAQTYRLALIRRGKDTTVEILSVPADNQLQIPIEIGGDVNEVILVVSGATRFTRQQSPYSLSVVPR